MKKSVKKLKLNRETLCHLTDQRLRTLAGGGPAQIESIGETQCTGCDMSPLCAPTYQVGCQTEW
jgi:hypothetical protein